MPLDNKSSIFFLQYSGAEIFDKSELINIEYSDKVGIEQKNEFNCK